MTLEYESRRIQEIGTERMSGEFLNRLLDLEVVPRLPKWGDLPHNFDIPMEWGKTIRHLIATTTQKDREVGVLGYLPPNKFQPQDIRFGKLALGDKNRVVFKKEGGFSFSLPEWP